MGRFPGRDTTDTTVTEMVFTAGIAPAFQPSQGRVLSVGRREHETRMAEDLHPWPVKARAGFEAAPARWSGSPSMKEWHHRLESHQAPTA